MAQNRRANKQPISVMIVADGAKLDMLRTLIESMPDMRVAVAVRSNASALEMLESVLPDVVYIAHHSGVRIDGLELIEELHAWLPHLPLLMDTVDRQAAVAARSLHAYAVLQQPIQPMEIVRTIRDAARTARAT